MRHTSFVVSTGFFVRSVFVSLLFFLVGCAPRSVQWAVPHGSAATPTLRAIGNQSHTKLAQAPVSRTPTPQPVQMLPEAGGAHPTAQTIPPTAMPPTAKPIKSTAQPTTPPTAAPKSPTPTQGPAPAVPTRLVIPAINLDTPVIAVGWSVTEQNGQQVSEWDVPSQRMAGWLNTSALAGARGNTVLVGHQNIDGRVFENLEYLKQGDEIQVQAGTATRRYIVTARMILLDKDQPIEVRRENARWIGPSNDERLTLVTCWPRNDNTHRLILVALPAP